MDDSLPWTEPPASVAPLLAGDERQQALDAIEAIGAGLATLYPRPAEPPRVRDIGLASGQAGLALFFAEMYRAGLDQSAGAAAQALIDAAMDDASRVALGPYLCNGWAGVAWTALRLASLGCADPPTVEAFCARTDEVLLDLLRTPLDGTRDPLPYELLYGLVGLGVYALDRRPRPAAESILDQIISRLLRSAEQGSAGLMWRTTPEQSVHAEQFPEGYVDLGLAHGTPGVVAFLALANQAGVQREFTVPLLDLATMGLLGERRGAAGETAYAWSTAQPWQPSRLAWCYGDPGVAAALSLAARAQNEPAWEQAVREIALNAVRLPTAAAHVADSQFCHGAVGLGHVYWRLAEATGEPSVRDAARRWTRAALTMRRVGGRLGGFSAYLPAHGEAPARRIAARGLIDGAAGVGLALIAAATGTEPSWDRVFLLS